MDKRKFGRAKRGAVYDTLSKQDVLERVATRDVYGTQHLERSTIEDPQTMTSRTILAVIFGLVIAFLLYWAMCVVGNFSSAFMGGSGRGSTQSSTEQSADVTVEGSGDVVDAELGDMAWNKDANGAKPLSEAPASLTMEGLKANYLVYQPADVTTGNTTDCYVDSEGNRYLEGDLPGLLDRVHGHEFMSADRQEIERLKALRAAGPYNILPLNLAPMNITLKDFTYLYFSDTNPERVSAIRKYYDYDGNIYDHAQIEALWKKVQTGEIGLGRESYLGEDGGYDADGNSVAGGSADVGESGSSGSGGNSSGGLTPAGLMSISWRPVVFVISLVVGLLAFLILYEILKRNLDAQNAETDVTDINQYPNDQHIQVPEELQRNYDWFPDVGAHSTVMVSGMLSHMMLMNKGLKKVEVTRRATKDVVDENGNIVYFKGEALLDDDDNEIVDVLPIIDEKFGDALFTASGTPNDKRIRKLWDATKIPYNPGNQSREKLKGYDTVADLINGDWEFPSYEVQRPAGAYIVDTEPVNTMVLAITRAGKGQTYIEPTIDMWTRERTPNNMVINDPKGELLVKFYVKAAVRGFQPVQFNLINAMKTDIYNPLMMAAQAAREGDFTKCALYVENIAEVFFPTDGAEDPVWPNAANNAFKRAAYGLIDYYVEEEKEERLKAEKTNMDPKVLDGRLDVMWGRVTLYNCYQLFVQLTSKKLKNPFAQFAKDTEAGKFNEGGMQIDPKTGEMVETKRGAEPLTQEEWEERRDECKKDAELWEDKPEIDALTLYFNATAHLPRNQMRNLIANADNALRSMGAAEKMLASVYGIAITAMSFFTDPTISTLTSGTPSQNVDLGGLSFPRRFGVRMHPDFVKRYHLLGLQCKWDAFEDAGFTKKMGKDFVHDDILNREGWAMCYFKGKFPKDIAYLRLRLMNSQTGSLVRTFYFQFKKSYQMSLDSRYYVKDPVLDEKIVKNGILVELKPVKGKNEGEVVYKKAKTLFPQIKVKDVLKGGTKEKVQTPAITQTMVRYSDKPKIIFLVTPPHLMKYAKLILILVKQLVDLNFDKSYMTKSNQKPLYKTRFMLDELGNLQSEGHGISGFQTMLSIGLGQEQQFTLILQTLQQLRDVYGESVDKIVQGNTSNIIFLKSTDDSMIETLQKMSGTTHKVFRDSKTITKDKERLFFQNEGKITYTYTAKEVPTIAYNDMAFISPRNSIVFRAGDSPIWNRNETILPMSWKLFSDTIVQPGKDYTLQTIPTLSSALDFDVRKNQPDFFQMVEKRKLQARYSDSSLEAYKRAYGYNDYAFEQLDPDVRSDELMEVINQAIREYLADKEGVREEDLPPEYDINDEIMASINMGDYEDNLEQEYATAQQQEEYAKVDTAKFAGGTISPNQIVGMNGQVNHGFDSVIVRAFKEYKAAMFKDTDYFKDNGDGSLYGADGTLYIHKLADGEDVAALNRASQDAGSRVYAEEDVDVEAIGSYIVKDAFLRFLAKQESWDFAGGKFDEFIRKDNEG